MGTKEGPDGTTAPASSTLEGLVEKESHLLRLNDQIDADARAVLSDAERFLQEGGVAPSRVSCARTPKDGGVVRTSRPASGAGEARPGAGGAISSRTSVSARDGSLGSVRAPMAGGLGGGLSADTKAERGGNRTGSPPLFRVSQRVKDAARASGERNGRGSPGSRLRGEGVSTPGELSRHQTKNEPSQSRDTQAGTEHGMAGTLTGIASGIGPEATIRFLKAKLRACEEQLQEAQSAHHAAQQEALHLRRQVSAGQEERQRVARDLHQMQQAVVKDKKNKVMDEGWRTSLSARVAELEKDLTAAQRVAKQAEADNKSLEVRLHRAVEEAAKQKAAATQAQGQHTEAGQGHSLQLQRLEGQCQRLERQKMELLSAFKKQLKLIDVLKRQKFHVEAARLLAFTEEDFVKTLDWAA